MPPKSKHKWKLGNEYMSRGSRLSSHGRRPKMKENLAILITTVLIHSLVQGTLGAADRTDLFHKVPEEDMSFEPPEDDAALLNSENYQSASNFSSYSSLEIDEMGNGTGFNPYANLSVEELMELEIDDNPLRDPLSIAIPMTLIYSLILLSGLVGNMSTCIVIARTSYMHTATNYYLFSLAMSDLLLLISGLPQEIYHIWVKYPYIFGEAFCLIRGLAAETSANATVLTITAFTVERFPPPHYPLKSHKLSQLSRPPPPLGIIWGVAFCLALPQSAQFGVKDQMSRYNPDVVLIKGAWCTLVREIFPYAFQISICVFFVIPMTVISVLYILIGLKLRRSRKSPLNHEPRLHPRHSQSHVVRMLVAVVVAFFIGWFPFHAQRLMALYGSSQKVPSDFFMLVYQGLTHVSGILYYLSTCVNPILYHIMSNKFRQAFKDTMGHFCGRPSPSRGHHTRTYSAMSYSHNRSLRMTHYTSQRAMHLNKNNPAVSRGVNLSMKIDEESNIIEKFPLDMNLEGRNRRASCSHVGNPNSNGNSNGMMVNIDNSTGNHTFPCSCPVGEKMLTTPKTTTTTILSSNKSVVTRAHCPLCGGCANLNGNGGGRGVTFGFLGKVRHKSANHLLFRNGKELNDHCGSDNDTTTVTTPLNSSPPEKENQEDEIPMADMKVSAKSNGKLNHSSKMSPLHLRLDSAKSSKPKPSLKTFLRRKKGKSRDNCTSLTLSGSDYTSPSRNMTPYRLPSDPSIPSSYAVTILDGSSKGHHKSVLQRERTGSSGNVIGASIPKNTCRATSYTSMDSAKSNNTISNSSLQDMDEVEYTSEELAGYMAELNLNIESPKNVQI